MDMGAGQPDAGVVDGQHRSNVPAQGGPGPDRLAVRRCLPDCRNAGYRVDRTLTFSFSARSRLTACSPASAETPAHSRRISSSDVHPTNRTRQPQPGQGQRAHRRPTTSSGAASAAAPRLGPVVSSHRGVRRCRDRRLRAADCRHWVDRVEPARGRLAMKARTSCSYHRADLRHRPGRRHHRDRHPPSSGRDGQPDRCVGPARTFQLARSPGVARGDGLRWADRRCEPDLRTALRGARHPPHRGVRQHSLCAHPDGRIRLVLSPNEAVTGGGAQARAKLRLGLGPFARAASPTVPAALKKSLDEVALRPGRDARAAGGLLRRAEGRVGQRGAGWRTACRRSRPWSSGRVRRAARVARCSSSAASSWSPAAHVWTR